MTSSRNSVPPDSPVPPDPTGLLERAQAVLDTAVDAILTISDRGIIETANPAVQSMFGYSVSELVGRNVSVLMPEPYCSAHDEYLRHYLETGQARIIGIGRRVSGMRRDGSSFPIHLAVSEFRNESTRKFTGIIRDLTELEQVQEQLLQSERLVAIGQMVAGLAHESRNALQRAQACLDMLALDLFDQPELNDLVRRATTALHDLYRLYDEVRGYAAPIHLEYRDCSLAQIWRKEWDNLAAVRGDRPIELEETDECRSVRCSADVHRMGQVFRNILENAIHACGTSGIVRIRCSSTDLSGEPALRLLIEDDGCGLTPAALKQIFEPFFTTKQKGTGLGMAIVHRIITAHSGQITARLAPVRGTQISIVLPVQPPSRNDIRTTADHESAT